MRRTPSVPSRSANTAGLLLPLRLRAKTGGEGDSPCSSSKSDSSSSSSESLSWPHRVKFDLPILNAIVGNTNPPPLPPGNLSLIRGHSRAKVLKNIEIQSTTMARMTHANLHRWTVRCSCIQRAMAVMSKAKTQNRMFERRSMESVYRCLSPPPSPIPPRR